MRHYTKMKLSTKELNKWVEGYIKAQEKDDSSLKDEQLHWAIQKFFDLEIENPDLCWKVILEILHREPSEKVLGMLAAGPLEDLIENHGPKFIARIEDEAKTNRDFKKLLQGVWESSTEEVWNRVLKARR